MKSEKDCFNRSDLRYSGLMMLISKLDCARSPHSILGLIADVTIAGCGLGKGSLSYEPTGCVAVG
jgi:hypothetical protein